MHPCWPKGVSHLTDPLERANASAPSRAQALGRDKGVFGLRDEGRSGRPREIDRLEVIAVTLTAPPKKYGITRWSTRLLASTWGSWKGAASLSFRPHQWPSLNPRPENRN